MCAAIEPRKASKQTRWINGAGAHSSDVGCTIQGAIRTGEQNLSACGRLFLRWCTAEDDGCGAGETTRDEHGTRTSTVRRFNSLPRSYFNGWETLAEDLSWEMIYVQHEDSTAISAWQGCVVVAYTNVAGRNEREDPQAIAAFWNQRVRQCQVAVLAENFRSERQTQRGRQPEGQGKGGGEQAA
ncbi:retrotransposon hot spot (RHS) protein [Trypanosoma rangeli]|uniref:Retrotransposon hot spot (RHS) protein n=1 Tax=Trypanosoma rangeli TaxID=5698 RepID=A0A3R7M2W2_TRYRA|nr:retrotransposon hot spot (RHS) protein [Trypanosoma rangeli]RNE98381.1 retrotransposon hot spot (RHS) protein [Trypanosoma rangeli]|eukprot:RNE98381.1 retrotransposon hot spot (RHS) protein [Trypanosoma rangeli]